MKINLLAVLLMVTLLVHAVDTNQQADDPENTGQQTADTTSDDQPAAVTAEQAAAPAENQAPTETAGQDKERVWQQINAAVAGLNELVGDELFRELVRRTDSEMEVRVDAGYWKRVRYETRVELKTDISRIWHLYAQQYNDAPQSSVFFIDDDTGKTIDIYTRAAN